MSRFSDLFFSLLGRLCYKVCNAICIEFLKLVNNVRRCNARFGFLVYYAIISQSYPLNFITLAVSSHVPERRPPSDHTKQENEIQRETL
jgi:hypothetical protein